MPTKTEVIKRFLDLKTHKDLADLYNYDMEVQVNVAKENGKQVEFGEFRGREWRAFTDGINIWKPFRIPLNANSDPEYKDSPMSFSLESYAEGIGMTGWDWKNKVSRWVAFDFDAIVGHSDSHSKKLDESQLKQIEDALKTVPFVTLRRSTSGKGLHLYIFLDPVSTSNHTEHAALSRAILSMLSGLTAFDFASKVDVCGGNMWVWHRKMTVENKGLSLIKAGEKLSTVPANWRDHINVVTRKTRKSIPEFVYNIDSNTPDKLFTELTGQRTRIPLDKDHRKLIDWLAANNCVWWWDQDNWMLVTHTIHLKDAHCALRFCGQFETIATGADKGHDHNAFCFPLRNGAWAIRRYSPGTQEHESWDQDGKRWTRCYYNKEADFFTLTRLNGGIENEKGSYVFRTAQQVQRVLLGLGVNIDLPQWIMVRRSIIKPLFKDDKLAVQISAESHDKPDDMPGWDNEKKMWKRIFKVSIPTSPEPESDVNYDDILRHVVSGESDAGWLIKRDGIWVEEPLIHIKAALGYMGNDPKETHHIVGASVLKSWTLVNKPFQPEYPGNREWNRGAANFAVLPTQNTDKLEFPHWQMILDHCGESLNNSVLEDEWCKEIGIAKGSQFLMLWLASLFKQPDKPTTYLAFYGSQDSGKSIFHEMVSEILVTGGVMRADNALTNPSAFNQELASAFLCTIEETDLRKNKLAYNRIKDWVTSPQIMIHQKMMTPYMIQNCTHYIQCCNEIEEVPIFEGDTRITLIKVNCLPPEKKIPKSELMTLLRKEAPDFLAAVLAIQIPRSNSRLAVPTIMTPEKIRAAEKNLNLLEQFIKECVNEVNGYCVSAEQFFMEMQMWLDERDRSYWTKSRIGRELPDRIVRGRLSSNQLTHYGNITFDKTAVETGKKYIQNNLFIKLVDNA